jgi:anthranilate synthase/aminodeoxychorismate synthase-like glutamine amidotransferase
MILLIDNYDSFVHNLARYFRRLGQETVVVRNDVITTEGIRRCSPEAIVISPGPCTPRDAGISTAVVREFFRQLPILGVCLGHQAIAAAWGANIVRAREPMHGRTSPVTHNGTGLFEGLPSPLSVCRYHSLVVDEASLPAEVEVTSRTADGTIMGLQHRESPVYGVQFHPEATLTQDGFRLLANFLRLAGLDTECDLDAVVFSEFTYRGGIKSPLPGQPVTF